MATTNKWGECMHQHTSIVQLFSYLFVTIHMSIRRSFTNFLKKASHCTLMCSAVQCSQVQDSAMHAIIIILGYIQISNTRNTIEQNNRYELLYNALWKDVRFSYRETHTHRESERRLARALYSIINIYYFCPGKHFCSFCRISCQIPRSIPHTKFNNEINWTECAKAHRTHRAAVWNKQMRMRKFNKKRWL